MEASGGARYQLACQVAERFAEALETSGGEGGGVDGSVLQALMAMLLSEKLDAPVTARDADSPR